jgi:redox-sensitive bicupin YhaK (pirin superfamily)
VRVDASSLRSSTLTVLHRLLPKSTDLGGGIVVERVLPNAACRKVGPWVFLDSFGPAEMTLSPKMDVRPHPHCGLSTVTFLFAGAMEHRDSTGGHAVVRAGEIHWMRGGHGVVHSERVPRDLVGTKGTLGGLQLWCAHPDGEEDQDPSFNSWTSLPTIDVEGVAVELLAGNGWQAESPVDVTSNLVYAIASAKAGQRLPLPDHEERCVLALDGKLVVDGEPAGAEMVVVDGRTTEVVATTDARVLILGGDAIGPRHMWWNLVHSDRDRLKEQARRWREGEFPTIEGDDEEFIPAPPDGPL